MSKKELTSTDLDPFLNTSKANNLLAECQQFINKDNIYGHNKTLIVKGSTGKNDCAY